jgi:two-component sensor histidine kinase
MADKNTLVLAIDDEPDLLQIISRVLTKAGYALIGASSGQEGLRLAQQHKPDLILIDVVLPDIDGFDVCQQLKANAELVDSFVVLISSIKTASESQVKGLCAGADDYITRPLSNRELLARVDTMQRLQQAQKNVRRAYAQIEIKVAERTAELREANEQLHKEIARHRQTEQALRESQARYQDLVERLQASLEEKMVLLREIHHRVKNNLQVICSLLDLQAESVQEPETLQALRDSQSRVRSMALVHETLYRTQDLARINMSTYIQSEIDHLHTVYYSPAASAAIHVKADNILMGIDTAIPCGLIINELVTNALKHAFPPGLVQKAARIDVRFSSAGQMLMLQVSDNGVGLPADMNWDTLPSLGLQLVHLLIQQLHGSIRVDTRNGTTFEISFPEHEPADF